jgi:hypothetical protein
MKWTRGSTKRQCNRALGPDRVRASAHQHHDVVAVVRQHGVVHRRQPRGVLRVDRGPAGEQELGAVQPLQRAARLAPHRCTSSRL